VENMGFLEGLPFYDVLENLIENTLGLDAYLTDGYNFLMSLEPVTKLIGVLLAGIIFIMGTFELIKKLSKIIVVVGILVGLYLLYDSGALDGLLGG
jgi:hypothetical protein